MLRSPGRNSLLAHQILTTVHETIVNGFWTLHLIQHIAGSRDLHLPQPNKLQKKVPLAQLWSFMCKDPTLGTSKPYYQKRVWQKKRLLATCISLQRRATKIQQGNWCRIDPRPRWPHHHCKKSSLAKRWDPRCPFYGCSRSERGLLHVAAYNWYITKLWSDKILKAEHNWY